MLWSLLIERRLLKGEPASIVCDEEQGDLFHRPTREPASITPNARRKLEKGYKNGVERTGKVEMREGKIPGSRWSKHGNRLTYSRL